VGNFALKVVPARPQESGRPAVLAALAVAAAMMLGGGGSPSPLPEVAAQVAVAMLFAAWLVWGNDLPLAGLRTPALLCGLLLALPLIQLIPLPPAWWHALPGRELERAALDLVGAGDSWRPLSVAPARTLNSLLALVPPAMVLVLTASLGPAGRSTVVGMVAGVSILAMAVGAAQAAGGEASPFRFYVPDAGYLNGFQANHNSSADVLLIGMVAWATVVQDWIDRSPSGKSHLGRAIVLAGVGLLSIGVFLTASRAGTALLPVAWLAVYAITRGLWAAHLKPVLTLGAVGAALIAAAIVALRHNAVVAGVLSRYDFASEFRPQLWVDSLYAARLYFPFGAGMGTFFPVFVAAERLEVVDTTLPNRAHNDYLELAMEGGVFGFIALAILAALLARMARQRLRDRSRRVRRQAIFAVSTLTLIALHSQVDYPLRSVSLACIAAAAAGLLVQVWGGARGTNVPANI